MRFPNWYSIFIVLILTSFVAMIGAFFVKTSNICLFCLVSKKAADCEQFKKGFEALGQQAAVNLRDSVGFLSQQTKQGYITYFNSAADGEEKITHLWESLQMQEPKSKQIQSLYVEGSKLVAKGQHDYAKTLELQPGEFKLTLREVPFPTNQGLTKIRQANDELAKYCPNLFDAHKSAKPNAAVSTP